jgi:hypothetical protein
MSDEASAEAYLHDLIERALAPYADKVPPAVLEEMRLAMREDLAAHPVASSLARRLRPRATPMQSDDVEIPGVAQEKAGSSTNKR